MCTDTYIYSEQKKTYTNLCRLLRILISFISTEAAVNNTKQNIYTIKDLEIKTVGSLLGFKHTHTLSNFASSVFDSFSEIKTTADFSRPLNSCLALLGQACLAQLAGYIKENRSCTNVTDNNC